MLEPRWDQCLYKAAVIELKLSWFKLVGAKSKPPSDWFGAPLLFRQKLYGHLSLGCDGGFMCSWHSVSGAASEWTSDHSDRVIETKWVAQVDALIFLSPLHFFSSCWLKYIHIMYIDHLYRQLNCSLRRFVSSWSTSFHLKGAICKKKKKKKNKCMQSNIWVSSDQCWHNAPLKQLVLSDWH